jgi:hypothetical protein
MFDSAGFNVKKGIWGVVGVQSTPTTPTIYLNFPLKTVEPNVFNHA